MTSDQEVPPVIGAIADDREGKPVGTVTAVFVDDVTGRPTWVGLTDGLHAAPDATDVAIVAPIADAQVAGGRVRLAVSADAVHSSPRPAASDRLSPEEELTLRDHYAGGTGQVGGGTAGTDRTDTVLIDTGRSGTDLADADRAGRGTGDGTMTRSEERITVDSVTEPWARAVLRIEEVTEEVMVPVTITRQQARIEYLPLRGTDGIIDRRPGAGSAPMRTPAATAATGPASGSRSTASSRWSPWSGCRSSGSAWPPRGSPSSERSPTRSGASRSS
jgi:uncharacterized protein DUF2382